jgi:hypothetical protein
MYSDGGREVDIVATHVEIQLGREERGQVNSDRHWKGWGQVRRWGRGEKGKV